MTQLTQKQPVEGSPVKTTAGAPQSGKSAGSRLIVLVLIILLFGGAMAVVRRLSEKKALAKETERLAVPTVSVLKPAAEPASEELTLPAQLQAYVESAIYSRTNGYLLRWNKDIGSRITKGELLAEIDTPEVDQELSQAKGFTPADPGAIGTGKKFSRALDQFAQDGFRLSTGI